MSCQWRQNSHDNWEMTQSNPPSELPNDPIISTSSNPDERSSSPAIKNEQTQGESGQPMTRSLFSQAALADTEPIPRDNYMPNPYDMLVPDSPSHRSFASDFDDHIKLRRKTEAEATQTPGEGSRDIAGRQSDCSTVSDESDGDFEMPESDGDGSDSTYIAEATPRRGKKKAPDKKGNKKDVSVAKESNQANSTKGRQRKAEPASNTAPKRTKQIASPVDTQNTKAKPLTTQNLKSRHFQKADKDQELGKHDKVVRNSPSSPSEKQAKPKPSAARLPKKSFYGGRKDDIPTQVAQRDNASTKPQSVFDPKSGSKQSSGSQKQVRPASPIVIEDGDEGGDAQYILPSSAKEKERSSLKGPGLNKASLSGLEVDVGANSKKKRSPLQPEPKLKNPKSNTTRTYGQKSNKNIDKFMDFHEQKSQEALQTAQPMPFKSKQPKSQKPNVSDSGPNIVPSRNPAFAPMKVESNGSTERNTVTANNSEKSQAEAIMDDPEPGMDADAVSSRRGTYEGPGVPSAHKVSENNSDALVFAEGIAGDEAEQTAFESPAIHKELKYSVEVQGSHALHSGKQGGSPSQGLSNNSWDNSKVLGKQEVPNQDKNSKGLESKPDFKTSLDQEAKSLSSGQSGYSSQREIRRRDTQKSLGDFGVPVDHGNKATSLTGSKQSPLVGSEGHYQVNMNPGEAIQCSNIRKEFSSRTAGNEGVLGYNPLQRRQELAEYEETFPSSDVHQVQYSHERSVPLRAPPKLEPQPPPAFLPSVNYSKPRAEGIAQSDTLNDPDNHRYIPDPKYRMASKSSPSEIPLAESTDGLMSPAPQLHPKSVDFASRVAQGYEREEPHRNVERRAVDRKTNHQPAKQLSWARPKVTMDPRDGLKRPFPEPIGSMGVYDGKGPRAHSKQHNNPTLGSKNETRWKKAVEDASDSVIDTLHFISMSLLEHLRTREQKIFTIVNEYKRNGTRVTENIAKHQAEEWHNISAMAEKRCLEFATLYEALSEKTEDFRSRCMSKHRSQAYAEWQQQTARVKNAIRIAREETISG
ncbi:uncharacterized protein F4812DRAFT_460271 [Daldinia caldariorum]|uniref:uncharacterized protein n=1 Tax=Daldinia caldariorum TaxID=326644 RepID=UPI00200793BE|nr:uncharacterized protein F4812DRAFT_460271 [Daldinia caldariorum]KAI1466708.1 hypothetical protein F4812DRAFT_460271 [Daldinia caldariorum]